MVERPIAGESRRVSFSAPHAKNNNTSSELIFEIPYHNHNNTSPKQQQIISHYSSFHIIYFRNL